LIGNCFAKIAGGGDWLIQTISKQDIKNETQEIRCCFENSKFAFEYESIWMNFGRTPENRLFHDRDKILNFCSTLWIIDCFS